MNTIVAKEYVGIRDEKTADGAITPGMLVERTSAGKVKAHDQAGGPAAALFALEDENRGNGIDVAYANGDVVKLWRPVPGEQVYAIADDTTSNTIAIGDFLESDGTGRLRKATTLTSAGNKEFGNALVAVALEAVTPGSPAPRILVEIL